MKAEAEEPARPGGRFAALLVGTYFVVTGIRLWRHEMWRDELEVWHQCLVSGSLLELYSNASHADFPLLWHLLVYPLSRVTENPAVMQFLHLLLATLAIGLVALRGPFGRRLLCLFCVGYYPFFEYAVISRPYVLGFLFLTVYCAFYGWLKERPWAAAVLLALLVQTTAFGAVMAIALGVGYLVERITMGRVVILTLLVGLSCGLFLWVAPQQSQIEPVSEWYVRGEHGLRGTLAGIWRGLSPLPFPQYRFWNRFILEQHQVLEVGLSLVLLVFMLFVFSARPASLAILASGTVGILTLTHLTLTGAARYYGHFFLLLLAAWWLGQEGKEDRFRSSGLPFMSVLLVLQAVAGLPSAWMDFHHPLGQSRRAAQFIKENDLHDLPIVAGAEFQGSPISMWLGRPIYFAPSGRQGDIVEWDRHKRGALAHELLRTVKRVSRRHYGSDVIVVRCPHFYQPHPEEFELLAAFTQSLEYSEDYYIFRYSPEPR